MIADILSSIMRDFQKLIIWQRAHRLAVRFRLPKPTSVAWAEQRSQWGSCTPSTGEIRLSTRLAAWPLWVLDYVIMHELAHLVELNHTPAFNALADQYPLAERARGFLIAKAIYENEMPTEPDPPIEPECSESETGETLF